MEIYNLVNGIPETELYWKVVTVSVDDKVPYAESIAEIRNNPNADRDLPGLQQRYDAVATNKQGPKIYQQQTNIVHRIEGPIWQFRKSSLRALWFYGEGKIIVCTHCFIKAQQRTPKSEISKALKVYQHYREHKND